MHYMQHSKEKETKADPDYNVMEDIESIGLTLRVSVQETGLCRQPSESNMPLSSRQLGRIRH